MKAAMACAVAAAATVLGACGGSSGGGPSTSGSCTPGQSARVTIGAAGFSPKAVCVVPGGTVTLTNGDTVAHDIESGTTCTMLNLGPIAPGGTATPTFPTAMVCPFFDAAHSNDTAFQGTVAVSNAPTTGPGY